MFRAILRTQWARTRLVLLLLCALAIGLPYWAVLPPGSVPPQARYGDLQWLLFSEAAKATFFPMLAALTGVLLAVLAWQADHAGRHVYALTLPVARWRYVVLRYGAGQLLVLLVAVMLWVGALAATALTTVPAGLHAYPTALALRFALATSLTYALIFAISAGTSRTAGIILGTIGALVLLAMFGEGLGLPASNALGPVLERLFEPGGLFAVFLGRWMLVDL